MNPCYSTNKIHHACHDVFYWTGAENQIKLSSKKDCFSLNFLRTGYYDRSDGYIGNRTAYGYWWSDASNSATGGHTLATYPTAVYPQNYHYRGYGFAIRCVVREG